MDTTTTLKAVSLGDLSANQAAIIPVQAGDSVRDSKGRLMIIATMVYDGREYRFLCRPSWEVMGRVNDDEEAVIGATRMYDTEPGKWYGLPVITHFVSCATTTVLIPGKPPLCGGIKYTQLPSSVRALAMDPPYQRGSFAEQHMKIMHTWENTYTGAVALGWHLFSGIPSATWPLTCS